MVMVDMDGELQYSQKSVDIIRSLFPSEIVTADELRGAISNYEFAKRWADCESSCKGVDKCELHGYVPRIFLELEHGRRAYVVRVTVCDNARINVNQKNIEEAVKASRIPPEMEKCSFDNYKPPTASAVSAKNYASYCAERGKGIMLMGPPGVGKTHLAVAIVRESLNAGRSALFIPTVNLISEIKASSAFGKIYTLAEALSVVDGLALDDRGILCPYVWVSERLFHIINDRYNAKKQIVITTNARNLDDLAAIIGARGQQIASRLGEMATSMVIDADDYRMKKGAEARSAEAKQRRKSA
jgi:DNA replication protein DnaC